MRNGIWIVATWYTNSRNWYDQRNWEH